MTDNSALENLRCVKPNVGHFSMDPNDATQKSGWMQHICIFESNSFNMDNIKRPRYHMTCSKNSHFALLCMDSGDNVQHVKVSKIIVLFFFLSSRASSRLKIHTLSLWWTIAPNYRIWTPEYIFRISNFFTFLESVFWWVWAHLWDQQCQWTSVDFNLDPQRAGQLDVLHCDR